MNYSKNLNPGSPVVHEMTCGKDYIRNNSKRRVNLKAKGNTFDEAKEKIIKKLTNIIPD